MGSRNTSTPMFTNMTSGYTTKHRCTCLGSPTFTQPKVHATYRGYCTKEGHIDGDDCQHQIKGDQLIATLGQMQGCQRLSCFCTLFQAQQAAQGIVSLQMCMPSCFPHIILLPSTGYLCGWHIMQICAGLPHRSRLAVPGVFHASIFTSLSQTCCALLSQASVTATQLTSQPIAQYAA